MANFLQKLFQIEDSVEKQEEKEKPPEDPSENRVKGPYHMTVNSPSSGIERFYFWVIRYLEKAGAFGRSFSGDQGEIIKIRDVYTSAETSSYWGNIEQRKAAQQDKVSQYLANIGKFTKELFQLIREMRIIDERLSYYKGVESEDRSADVALKGIWIDIVEGGGKNPSSVYGLATQVGFVTLPDLFFDAFVKKSGDVDKVVAGYESRGINRKVREILGRKLKQYVLWRENTERELQQRRNFVLSYIAQEFNIIKMYAAWLKPYLENIKRLQQERDINKYDIVSAFETSKVELELLAVRKKYDLTTYYGNKEEREFVGVFPCVRIKFKYVAIPNMAYQQEYQRGAIHTGQTEITFEGFVATKEELERYEKKTEMEAIEIMAAVDETIGSLKDELYKYLEEAIKRHNLKHITTVLPREKPEEPRKESILEPFKAVFSGFKEIGKIPFSSRENKKEKEKKEEVVLSKKEAILESRAAQASASAETELIYDVFKKSHGMFTP